MIKVFCDICETQLTNYNSDPAIMKANGVEVYLDSRKVIRVRAKILLCKNDTWNDIDICNKCLTRIISDYLDNLPGD